MSEEDLSLKIAEHLEPRASFDSTRHIDPRFRHNRAVGTSISPKQLWTSDIISAAQGRPEWQPRNFITDPAMTVMLMGKLANQGYWFQQMDNEFCFEPVNSDTTAWYGSIGRAVAEAYAKAHGL